MISVEQLRELEAEMNTTVAVQQPENDRNRPDLETQLARLSLQQSFDLREQGHSEV